MEYILTPENINEPIPIETTILNCKRLNYLPESIGNLINLKELHCHNNHLQQLPETIGNLINLRYLDCCKNQLQELPKSIGNLINLQYFNCEDNNLTMVPDIRNCKALHIESFGYEGNPFGQTVLNIFGKYYEKYEENSNDIPQSVYDEYNEICRVTPRIYLLDFSIYELYDDYKNKLGYEYFRNLILELYENGYLHTNEIILK
jgi:Leucine-rich repeat (LRR) protein